MLRSKDFDTNTNCNYALPINFSGWLDGWMDGWMNGSWVLPAGAFVETGGPDVAL